MRLAIAGRPDDPREDWVLRHDRVDYLGILDRAAFSRECAASLCVVIPNQDFGIESFEGFGLVAPEAAMAGGVVLASNLFGLKSAIEDGVTGFLLDSDNAQGWADVIMRVRDWDSEKRQDFTSNARSFALKHYSWDRVARQTLHSYRQALSGTAMN